jgi:hypothetical protein
VGGGACTTGGEVEQEEEDGGVVPWEWNEHGGADTVAWCHLLIC